MTNDSLLPNLRTVRYADWLRRSAKDRLRTLCVATSGYESRSIHWVKQTLKHIPQDEHLDFYVAGFEDFKDSLSRPLNDRFYAENKIDLQQCGSSREAEFLATFEQMLMGFLSDGEDDAQVHIDYSSMPRRWYCELPQLVAKHLRPKDQAYFWYTPGQYEETTYPTAGVSDFKVFSGRPTLSCPSRTHLFGLGFDRIRSHAIWSILDPHELVCFYVDSTIEPSYVKRVRNDNREVLNAASHVFTVPLEDFVASYSKVVSIVDQFRSGGDVIIVPDGPKPLVLASSLVPSAMNERAGIVCFHVAKKPSVAFTPVDVPPHPIGQPLGFSFEGQKPVVKAPRVENSCASN